MACNSLTHGQILLPIPEGEVKVEIVMVYARTLGLCQVPKTVVSSPYPLRTFAITLPNTKCPMKAVLCVVLVLVQVKVQLRNNCLSLDCVRNAESMRPVDHLLVQLDIPLAGNIIADNERE